MNRWTRCRLASAVLAVVALTLLGTFAQGGTTTRVSVASGGAQVNGNSSWPSTSSDGRFVAFQSFSNALVAGDTNSRMDVFVHDRQTGQTTRVSVASNGTQGNDDSNGPSISSDGRFVAFYSHATNLSGGDTNGWADIFVHDRQKVETTRVSVATGGTQGNGLSGSLSISADGRFVAFDSGATNLVANDSNGRKDVFVHDRTTGATTRVSVASDETQGNHDSVLPSVSGDGRFVAFQSYASNLVTGDKNAYHDIFVHDRQTKQTTRVSVAFDGSEPNERSDLPSISSDGRFVAFQSNATNLVQGDSNGCGDVFVRDRLTGQTTRVSGASDGTAANDRSERPSISSDGRFIAFLSYATNLVAGDTNGKCDVFVHDRTMGTTTRVSVASDGSQANGSSGSSCPSISSNGSLVAFDSIATNLVAGDTNIANDIFVHDQGATAPPAVTSFAINKGAASTTSQAVTLDNTCTGSPTHYMASESPTFAGTAWAAYATAPSFTLSSGNGTKTVYLKVKSAVGESSVAQDGIVFDAGTVTITPVVWTQCPKVVTQCPTSTTSCPPTTTSCPSVTSKCPTVTTACPESLTSCPAAPTECVQMPTECPAVATQCPGGVTACPVTATKCPPSETVCTKATTVCPPVSTRCPAEDTQCPSGSTRCPVVTTKCPAEKTACPPSATRCPAAGTQCPRTSTACPPSATRCPAEETVCPARSTRCPEQETRCPAEVTVCPARATGCPDTETLCPAQRTVCPPSLTVCQMVETACPARSTLCPEVATKCPRETTACPPAATRCPPADTQCPRTTTACPPSATRCPAESTQCPAARTACPSTTTKCPAEITHCPIISTKCPPMGAARSRSAK